MEEENVTKEKITNPLNGAFENLYFIKENIKDENVEGKVLEGGFSNGLNAKSE